MKIQTTRVCTLMITHICNLNCIYCFEKFKSNNPHDKMSIDTAKKILSKEIQMFEQNPAGGRLAIELFGGEPLTNFPLIEAIYNWIKSKPIKFPYIFQITTNGTLFTDKIKQWFIERKNDFRIVMSVDGTENMQYLNRGCSLEKLGIKFVKEVWPNSYFKMTISSETLPNYASGLISLYQAGYKIASSLAEGVTWKENDDKIYEAELNKICNFFLENPNFELEHPFNFLFKEYLNPRINTLPKKKCGCGTTIGMYDIDGNCYPCHLFLPIVHGNNNIKNEIYKLDFTKDENLISEDCKRCKIVKVCKTCYGYNYIQRGDISKRDKSMCKLRLVEAKLISTFQIKYLMQKQQKEELNIDELLMLKAALRCYQDIKHFTF